MVKRIMVMAMLSVMTLSMWAAKVDKSITIKVGDENRSFILYVPNNVKTEAPLVFSLHGTGGASNNYSPFRKEVADTKGCIVVYPQGKTIWFPVFGGNLPGWHSTGEYSEDIDFFKAIIEEVDKQYKVDRKRIYCCGFSNGGMMTYTVANLCSDIFAAFASISGFPLNEFHLHHTSARPVPFLHIHGKADDFVKYSLMPNIVDNMVARNGCNPVPKTATSSGKYKRSTYEATEGGFPYVYYEIDGMGHSDFTSNTPNSSSALTMWNFLSQYTLDSECDTTLKWRPNIEAEGWAPKSHGWIMNSTTTLLMFGKDQKTDANQNTYRSLQLETGYYKLTFTTKGEEGKTVTAKLAKLTGKRTVVLNSKADVNTDAVMYFKVEDGWGEYKFTMLRPTTSDVIDVSKIEIHSVSEEEYNEGMTGIHHLQTSADQANIYSLSGIKQNKMKQGVNIVQSGKEVKKIMK